MIYPAKTYAQQISNAHNTVELEYNKCKACNEKIPITIRCNNCNDQYCHACYISSMKENEGLVICPYCKFKIGIKMKGLQLEAAIQNVQLRFLECMYAKDQM